MDGSSFTCQFIVWICAADGISERMLCTNEVYGALIILGILMSALCGGIVIEFVSLKYKIYLKNTKNRGFSFHLYEKVNKFFYQIIKSQICRWFLTF